MHFCRGKPIASITVTLGTFIIIVAVDRNSQMDGTFFCCSSAVMAMAYCPNNIDRLLRDLEHTQSRKRWRKKLFSSARKG